MEDGKKEVLKLPTRERNSTLQRWYDAMAPQEEGTGCDPRSPARREFCKKVLKKAEVLFKSFDNDTKWEDIIRAEVYDLKSSFRQGVYIC